MGVEKYGEVRRHDESYRLLFAQPRMVQGLLEGFVEGPWVRRLDFTSLTRVNGSYVSSGLERRESDMVWRVRLRDGRPVIVYLLLEFQSRVDRYMAVRLMAYVGLLYQDLIAQQRVEPMRLPLVVPIVLYNGSRPWTAPEELAELLVGVRGAEPFVPRLRYHVIDERRLTAERLALDLGPVAELFRIENSRRPPDILAAIRRLVGFLKGSEDEELRRAFVVWLKDRLLQVPAGPVELEEVPDMLENRVEQWKREFRREGLRAGEKKGLKIGLQKGLEEGRAEGRAEILLRFLERKFGPLAEEIRRRVQKANPELLIEWTDRAVTAKRLDEVFA